ncbi:flagellar export protein FliJ [Actinoplanes sp. N902-109]|uniref:flagellar export protein FliJ n=1 Tax=Actinoplanes sp. (strain N902-109) TaxID=649831 RepID=UPI00032960B7|nr:TolA family protein [Actinoplanes sp. N902-109]AGL21213.1 TolA family protein [Actinoplanes sp. N902-109]
MNRLFRLGPVLRARKAQEDAARGAVIQSRQEIRDAQALVKRRQLDLAGADAPTEGTARAMVASMVARQSLAASLSGAHQMVDDAEERTREKVAELADAAKRHRAVEMLSERHAEAVRRHDLTVDQNNIDEIAVTTKARNTARGVDTAEERGNTLRTGAGSVADRLSAAGRAAAEREGIARETANTVAAQRPQIDLADARQAIDAVRDRLSLVAKRPAEAAELDDEGNSDEDHGSR